MCTVYAPFNKSEMILTVNQLKVGKEIYFSVTCNLLSAKPGYSQVRLPGGHGGLFVQWLSSASRNRYSPAWYGLCWRESSTKSSSQ